MVPLANAQTTPVSTLLYPDVKMMPPSDFHYLKRSPGTGQPIHYRLHFSTRIRNSGAGALELHQTPNPNGTTLDVTQRIYESPAGFSDVPVGSNPFVATSFAFPVPRIARYEVWVERDFLRAQSRDFRTGQPVYARDGVSYCVADSEQIDPTTPVGVYLQCTRAMVGISVGWADMTSWIDEFQSIDFGVTPPPDGDYVLRAIADPDNVLRESAANDPARESRAANSAISYFRVANGNVVGVG